MLKPKTMLPLIKPQYIFDQSGKKTWVVLDIMTFEQLLEKLEDLYFGSMAHKALNEEEEFITHDEVKKKILAGKE